MARTARQNARVQGWNVVTLAVFGSGVIGSLLGVWLVTKGW